MREWEVSLTIFIQIYWLPVTLADFKCMKKEDSLTKQGTYENPGEDMQYNKITVNHVAELRRDKFKYIKTVRLLDK